MCPLKNSDSGAAGLTWHRVVVPHLLQVPPVPRTPRVRHEDAVEGQVLQAACITAGLRCLQGLCSRLLQPLLPPARPVYSVLTLLPKRARRSLTTILLESVRQSAAAPHPDLVMDSWWTAVGCKCVTSAWRGPWRAFSSRAGWRERGAARSCGFRFSLSHGCQNVFLRVRQSPLASLVAPTADRARLRAEPACST